MSASLPQQNSAAARAAAAADAHLDGAIADFFTDDQARLDDRARALLSRALDGLVRTIDTEIRRDAARLLASRGAVRKADMLLGGATNTVERLMRSGLLRDGDLMAELIGRVRLYLLAQGLPVSGDELGRASLLIRLGELPDRVIATAARALLVQENRRADANEDGVASGSDLPAELHHRLVWWIAAAVREETGGDVDFDRALGEAAQRSLAAHDESERVEAAAARLAAAIDPTPADVAPLLIKAIGDQCLPLFTAVLARGLNTDFEAARGLLTDPAGELFWPALRAVGLDRSAIAHIALALAEADPRRDIDRFADRLDEIALINPEVARAELAPLSLPHSFRAAISALGRSAA
jgi:hypothetical protein